MVEGMTCCTLDFVFFEHCIYGKQNQVIFAFGATRAKGILKLIHSDVFGTVKRILKICNLFLVKELGSIFLIWVNGSGYWRVQNTYIAL